MNTNTDYLIIGAGPAGLQLAYFLKKNGRDYLVLDRANKAGSFFAKMPRHRMLISINKVHTGSHSQETNLRWDWNALLADDERFMFKHYSQKYFPHPDDLVRYLNDFANHYELNIKYSTKVGQVSKANEQFVVTDAQGNTYTAKRLIVATGVPKPYVPDIPGAELCENYISHSIKPEDYINQRVLVVGKGNSAFETADNLIETTAAIHVLSPHSLTLAWASHYVGHLRAVNNNFLDTYQLKSQNTVIDAGINWIEKHDDKYHVNITYAHAQGQTVTIEYDSVIFCTGFRMDTSIFDESCKPALLHDDKLPAQTSEWESANVPNLFFAGTLMQACDYRKTMSGFIHGFRHNVQSLSNMLEAKYHQNEWPGMQVEATPMAVTKQAIGRANGAPGMFLQPGFLCDAMMVEDDTAVYHKDVRMDYVRNNDYFLSHGHYYTISLEYGHFDGDPFSVERDPDPDAAHDAAYLHPVIRRYAFGKVVATHHVNDDLESEWHKPEYFDPALAWFSEQLTPHMEMA
ncbi:MAG: NAD(P)-binding domain-containing protein [Anaerolineales bacterium]|nr:NAD(P)-binding domain-containing protein [Anaerolineales bacterium]MCB8990116.1 NAD(P)-binding domain-containing protein [Ardenticatenaceae bacterium]